MYRLLQAICFTLLVSRVMGEGIYSPAEIASPGYADIHMPAPVTIRDMNYSRIYQNQPVTYPQQYNHWNMWYNPYGYNYRAMPYPYYAAGSTGPNGPNYPLQQNRRQPSERRATEFSQALKVTEKAKFDESGKRVIDANTFRQLWIQAVGMTRPLPAISRDQVAAVVASKSSSTAVVIDTVTKSGDDIEVKLKEVRGFYQPDAEKPGVLSAAIFHKGSSEVKWVDAVAGSQADTEQEIRFISQGRFTFKLKDFDAVSVVNSSHRYQNRIYSKSEAETVLAKFKYEDSFQSVVDSVNYDREVMYFVGRFFRNAERARQIGSLAFEKVQFVQLPDNKVKHKIVFKESVRASDEGSQVNVLESEREDVVFHGVYVIVEKPRNFSEGPRPDWMPQVRSVDSHTGSLD